MVSRRTPVVLIITAILLMPLFTSSLPLAASAPDYTEDISVTLIGRSAYWAITMKGSNTTTITGLPDVENNASGVSSYSMAYMESSRWSPDFELFSNAGYNLLGFDTIPSSGIFLKVTAENADNAAKFADSVGALLQVQFNKFPSAGNLYTFYSHMDPFLTQKLFTAVPVVEGGAARLVDINQFYSQGIPIFKFAGEKSGSSFIHTVVIAGLRQNAVPATNEIKISDLIPNVRTINASLTAASSKVSVHVIGGFITYADKGNVTNYVDNRSSKVLNTVAATKPFETTVDMVQNFPNLIATRTVDKAALNQGDIATVVVHVKNAAPTGSTPVANITVADNWWQSVPALQFVDGESSRNLGHLAAGVEITLSYRLRLVSADKGEALAPASTVSYSYPIQGSTVRETVKMNALQLIFNDIHPAVSVEATVASTSYPILGSIPVNLTIRNAGNGHAANLEVAGNTRPSLLSGETWKLTVNLPPTTISTLKASSDWVVNFDDGGQRKQVNSNSITIYYDLTGSALPSFEITSGATPTVKDASATINETITVTNKGKNPLEKVSLKGTASPGFTMLGGNYTQQGTTLSAQSTNVANGSKVSYIYTASVSNPDENYVIQPSQVTVEASGLQITRLTDSEVIPLGVKITKTVTPTTNFEGGNVTLDARVVNKGSVPIYDVVFAAGTDTFMNVTNEQTTYTKATMNKDDVLGGSNQALLVSAGEFNTSEAATRFNIAGHTTTKISNTTTVTVYSPISAALTVNPAAPVEKQEFTATLTVKNPSAVTVKGVNVAVNLPTGFRVTSGSLQVNSEDINPNATITKSATIISDNPVSTTIPQPKVTFTYSGETFNGASAPADILVRDNSTTRYAIPLAVAAILILATVLIARKTAITSKAAKTA
ncbi:MAG: hypothetical protein HYY22_01785 [Thaumarchaeota archaeon]|nr:hypothetical protein [Nitrososphaerota archaeon]